MKSTELRIGNLVYPFKDTPKKALGVGANILVAFTDSQFLDCEIHQIEPIPLTEEWLLKFGFQKGGFDYLKNNLEISKLNNGIFDAYCTDLESFVFISEIKYVHQLQNLYFALTGDELTVNER